MHSAAVVVNVNDSLRSPPLLSILRPSCTLEIQTHGHPIGQTSRLQGMQTLRAWLWDMWLVSKKTF